jgi:alginate O-acetyltransferase complex protein AlgI
VLIYTAHLKRCLRRLIKTGFDVYFGKSDSVRENMVFSSILFLFVFLPVILLVYFLVPKPAKNMVLLIGSCIFYAWGEPVYILLMLFSVAFNFVIGLDLERSQKNAVLCRRNLIFGIAVDVFVLFYFKYTGFVFSIFHLPFESIALPIGISFYTFQTMSYIIDVYRKKVEAQKNFFDFALYVTMFPQLIAGPIVRYSDICEQIHHRKISLFSFGVGTEYFIKGLAKKVLLANNMGAVTTAIQTLEFSRQSVLTAWLGAIAYTMQIYFDFSGYSDMAIGLGKMFGFDFMKNFDYPYCACSITEFWRKWHISLGSWFREYVYIPLGGNRVSVGKHIRNIFIVWFLTGMWHGASWNFILWGLYYGILLLLEKYFLHTVFEHIPVWTKRLYTMFFVIIGWVIFMSSSLQQISTYLGTMFGSHVAFCNSTTGYFLHTRGILFILCMLCCTPFVYRYFKKIIVRKTALAIVINAFLFFVSVSYLVYDTYNPFLYFRF